MRGTIERLPVIVINLFGRCNCRCRMCDIWRRPDAEAMSLADLARHLDDLEKRGLEWVVFSGGEPLMHPRIVELCREVRRRNLRLTLLSTGLLMERFGHELAGEVSETIVSLDGPPEVHDDIRRVAGAFRRLEGGVATWRRASGRARITARCTVQARNCGHLGETVWAAKDMGLDGISFLAVDVHSTAFNREQALGEDERAALTPDRRGIELLEPEVEGLIATGECAGFIAETPAKLRRIVHLFRARLDGSATVAPACNAPWNSAVLESNGEVRPCFFQRSYGTLTPGSNLWSVINGPQAIAFRQGLRVADNPICRRCVCSLNYGKGLEVGAEPDGVEVRAAEEVEALVFEK